MKQRNLGAILISRQTISAVIVASAEYVLRDRSSVILVSGWHKMGYTYSDGSYISQLLVDLIQKLHGIVGNAITEGKYFVFGSGLTQLLNAVVYALSPDTSVLPLAKVLATPPLYPVYRTHSQFFNARSFSYEGSTSSRINNTVSNSTFIEFVTSPSNPDGKLTKGVLKSHRPCWEPIWTETVYPILHPLQKGKRYLTSLRLVEV
ncbi:hypothetical protein ACSQ67_024902 [Phaseolus vulgaris]